MIGTLIKTNFITNKVKITFLVMRGLYEACADPEGWTKDYKSSPLSTGELKI